MSSRRVPRPPVSLLACPLFLACACALAQPAPAPQVQEAPALEGRRNQKVEILHAEDDAVAIDEVRYAGQTQSTRVTPKKSALPAYEMQQAAGPQDPRDPGPPASRRVWNVLGF